MTRTRPSWHSGHWHSGYLRRKSLLAACHLRSYMRVDADPRCRSYSLDAECLWRSHRPVITSVLQPGHEQGRCDARMVNTLFLFGKTNKKTRNKRVKTNCGRRITVSEESVTTLVSAGFEPAHTCASANPSRADAVSASPLVQSLSRFAFRLSGTTPFRQNKNPAGIPSGCLWCEAHTSVAQNVREYSTYCQSSSV